MKSTEAKAIKILAEGPADLRQLAFKLGVSRVQAYRVTNSLSRKGWVEKGERGFLHS
ncbi:MAG: helix-turn-helix domain-containing protein [Candidatus Caldarchaeum sp.]|nr:helix-turn-helix domain-containing protein [Candidatus Caldarchaeum sp.]